MAGRRGQQETGTSVRKQHSPARDETDPIHDCPSNPGANILHEADLATGRLHA